MRSSKSRLSLDMEIEGGLKGNKIAWRGDENATLPKSKVYKSIPSAHISASGPRYTRPFNISGEAY